MGGERGEGRGESSEDIPHGRPRLFKVDAHNDGQVLPELLRHPAPRTPISHVTLRPSHTDEPRCHVPQRTGRTQTPVSARRVCHGLRRRAKPPAAAGGGGCGRRAIRPIEGRLSADARSVLAMRKDCCVACQPSLCARRTAATAGDLTSLVAYSMAARGSWIEHGPTTTSCPTGQLLRSSGASFTHQSTVAAAENIGNRQPRLDNHLLVRSQ